MRRYRLSPPGGPLHFARGCRPGRATAATTPTGLAFLEALDRALRANPPPARDRPLLKRLARVGVGPGLNPLRANLPSDVLDASGRKRRLDRAPRSTTVSKLQVLKEAQADHGWATIGKDIGAFGTDYAFRAVVAELGLGANTPREALYPTALTDSNGQLLTGSDDYRLVFKRGQAPPNRAFWSLTMYDGSGFLVAEPGAPLRDRQHPSAVAPRARRERRRSDPAHAPDSARRQLAAVTDAATSGSTCASTGRRAACSTGAGSRRRCSPSLPDPRPHGRQPPGAGSGGSTRWASKKVRIRCQASSAEGWW